MSEQTRNIKMPLTVSLFELDEFAKKINCVLHMNDGEISLIRNRAPIKKQPELKLVIDNRPVQPAADLIA